MQGSKSKAGRAGKKPRVKSARPERKPKVSRPDRAAVTAHGELRAIEKQLQSLVEAAAIPIIVLSSDFKVLALNPEACALYGRRRPEILGRGYFRTLDPDGRGGIARADFDQVLAGAPARGIEGKVRRPDGTERVLLWNATRLLSPAGRTRGIIIVAQDITERQNAEQALREREARISSIISTAPDGIITIDEKGVIQSFSSAAEKVFGYTASEVIGRNISMLMPAPHHEAHDGYLARYRQTGEKRIIGIGRQVEARRKDASVFPVELAVGEARIGPLRIFTGFIRDITARARLEEELRHAQKMESIGQLTGGMAHDFNNLLTVIIGNLEMLDAKLGHPDDRELLSEAQDAAQLGANLAGRMLAFGRRQPLNPKPIDINGLVTGMTELLRRSLGAAIKVKTKLAPSLPLTIADPGQVENALLNLAINARDAMPNGGKLIIETGVDHPDTPAALPFGRHVTLSVTDTGVGMTPEVRKQAFDPFFTTKPPGSGSGMGLSMVYGFVKQSGGHVDLDSEPGRGTTVRMFLPIGAAESAPREAQEKTPRPAVHNKRILVVEDDRRVRRVTVRRLLDLGYRVIEAGNAHEALAVLEREAAIDLVFTDIVMPGGMTGIDLAREARRRHPSLRILFTSGYADPTAIEQGRPGENADWLRKPYSTKELESKLTELLNG
jgi:PAS domain S-box-containing protein